MIYVVMAAVLGFAGQQLYKFVRRINAGCCSSGDCAGCNCSQFQCKGIQNMVAKDGGHYPSSQPR